MGRTQQRKNCGFAYTVKNLYTMVARLLHESIGNSIYQRPPKVRGSQVQRSIPKLRSGVQMTPTERAKEIVRGGWTANYCNGCITDKEWRKLESTIAAALTEARAEGFRECQEKAHEVAVRRVVHNPKLDYDAGWNRGAELIANEIKALAPEEK